MSRVRRERIEGARTRRRAPHSSIPGLIAAGLAVLSLVPIASTAAGASPSGGWGSAGVRWTNGVVACGFGSTHPTVSVSATGSTNSGLSVAFAQVSELTPNGGRVSFATSSGVGWMLHNASSADLFRIVYSGSATEQGVSGIAASPGPVRLLVTMDLPAYAESNGSDLRTVTLLVEVANWTWHDARDSLALTLPFWPSFGRSEHLVTPPSSSSPVTSVSNATGDVRESIVGASSGQVVGSTGVLATVPIRPQPSVTAELGNLTVVVDPSAGEFTDLRYTVSVHVVLGSTAAGLPLVDYIASAGGAAVIALLVAGVVRSARRRPSDLVEVENKL